MIAGLNARAKGAILAAVIVVMGIVATACSQSDVTNAAVSDDGVGISRNALTLNGVGVTFTPNHGHSIGTAEWQGVSRMGRDEKWIADETAVVPTDSGIAIEVRANLALNETSALWFKDRVPPSRMIQGNENKATAPAKLNFAFCGTLQSARSEAPLCIGLGYHTDEWWVGGANWIWEPTVRRASSVFDGALCDNSGSGMCITGDNEREQFYVFADGCQRAGQMGCVYPSSQWQANLAIKNTCTNRRACALVGFTNEVRRTAVMRDKLPDYSDNLPSIFPGSRVCAFELKPSNGSLHGDIVAQSASKTGNTRWVLLRSPGGLPIPDTRIQARVVAKYASESNDCNAGTQTANYVINWDPRATPRVPEQQCLVHPVVTFNKAGMRGSQDCALIQTATTKKFEGADKVTWDRTLDWVAQFLAAIGEAYFGFAFGPLPGLGSELYELFKYFTEGDEVLVTDVAVFTATDPES